MSIKISDLEAQLLDYIAVNPEVMAIKMIDTIEGLGFLKIYDKVENKLALLELFTDDPNQTGVRPGGFEPKTDISVFKNRIAEVQPVQAPILYTETQLDTLHRSHLSALERGQYDIPFEELILEKLSKAVVSYMMRSAFFKGVLNAGGTTSADLFNGWLTTIAADIISTAIPAANVAIVNITIGATVDATNALDHVNAVVQTVIDTRPEYASEDLVCLMAPENKFFYEKDYQATFNTLPYNQEFKKVQPDGINAEIKGVNGMAGSDRIIITPRNNFAFVTDVMEEMGKFEFWKKDLDLAGISRFKATVDYHIAELVWCNNLV